MTIDDDDIHAFLAHYGVKGMRWGVRNDKASGKQAQIIKAELKERRRLIDSGELSKKDARKGLIRLGERTVLGLLAGIGLGLAINHLY